MWRCYTKLWTLYRMWRSRFCSEARVSLFPDSPCEEGIRNTGVGKLVNSLAMTECEGTWREEIIRIHNGPITHPSWVRDESWWAINHLTETFFIWFNGWHSSTWCGKQLLQRFPETTFPQEASFTKYGPTQSWENRPDGADELDPVLKTEKPQ